MQRRYDIDWLRDLGILLLFPFNTARIFDIWDPFYVKNDVLSRGLSWFIALTGYWFMPLLFWLAGSASRYALQRSLSRCLFRSRLCRLCRRRADKIRFSIFSFMQQDFWHVWIQSLPTCWQRAVCMLCWLSWSRFRHGFG